MDILISVGACTIGEMRMKCDRACDQPLEGWAWSLRTGKAVHLTVVSTGGEDRLLERWSQQEWHGFEGCVVQPQASSEDSSSKQFVSFVTGARWKQPLLKRPHTGDIELALPFLRCRR